jgi:hypothetical protein
MRVSKVLMYQVGKMIQSFIRKGFKVTVRLLTLRCRCSIMEENALTASNVSARIAIVSH